MPQNSPRPLPAVRADAGGAPVRRSARIATTVELADDFPALDVDAWCDEYVAAVAQSMGVVLPFHQAPAAPAPLKKAS